MANPLTHNLGTVWVVVLPAAVVVTMAPRVEQVVLVMVSIDTPGGIVVIVEAAGPVGIAAAPLMDCAKSKIPPPLRLVAEVVMFVAIKSEGALEGKDSDIVLELILAVASPAIEDTGPDVQEGFVKLCA